MSTTPLQEAAQAQHRPSEWVLGSGSGVHPEPPLEEPESWGGEPHRADQAGPGTPAPGCKDAQSQSQSREESDSSAAGPRGGCPRG